MYTAFKDLSNGAEYEFQIFLHGCLTGIENVLEKCWRVSQFNTRFYSAWMSSFAL